MQTFLPSISFELSAKWLDAKRLGKQRVECWQILQALANPDYGWQSHPVVNIWRGYELSFIIYAMEICDEWVKRGYKDTCKRKITSFAYNSNVYNNSSVWPPPWLTEEFVSNHRAILLGKVLEILDNEKLAYNHAISESKRRLAQNRIGRAMNTFRWYQQFNWSEQPAQRVNGRWPYYDSGSVETRAERKK